MLGAAGGVSYHPNISPAVLEPVARDFPTVDFVIPHFGIQYVTDLLFLCWSCPNVHVDSSGSNQWVRWMPYKLTLDDLFQRFYETIGPERILFGSDSSWFPRGFAIRYLQDQIRICRFMGMSHDAPAADLRRQRRPPARRAPHPGPGAVAAIPTRFRWPARVAGVETASATERNHRDLRPGIRQLYRCIPPGSTAGWEAQDVRQGAERARRSSTP